MTLPLVAVVSLLAAAPSAAPRLATLSIPGDARFVAVARDVMDVAFSIDPSVAANAGLFEDAVRVPSYAPLAVDGLVARLEADLKQLRAMRWREWPVDRQIDFRWVYANAQTARRQLLDERLFERRPAAWLEPYANTLIAFTTYAPEARGYRDGLWAKLPGLLAEARERCTQMTRRDQQTAQQLVTALTQMASAEQSAPATAALAPLREYEQALLAQKPTREFAVIGPESYAWRLQNALLLPWTPAQLLEQATAELKAVDARMAELKPSLKPKAEPTAEQRKAAAELTRDGMLALHDAITAHLRMATVEGKFVTLKPGVGPVRARETPKAMVPLTGDGGSMNSPPPYAASDVGYWNVENFSEAWTEQERLDMVLATQGFLENGMGPYAAHEGFPGHHLQLALARLHKNPLRTVLQDGSLVEGWALYVEEVLWKHGGLGSTPNTENAVLRSFRHRIARVVFDAKVETGEWNLQQAADFKSRAEPGKGKIDEDLLRSIQWPTQLITYYAGKSQIRALRDELQRKQGKKFSERAFHDALLAEGSIPVALIRAKLLGAPVPDIDSAEAPARTAAP